MGESASKRQETYLRITPVSAQGIIERAYHKTGGRSNAIKAKCLDCCHWQREEVAACSVVICPLWAWRPFQKRGAS